MKTFALFVAICALALGAEATKTASAGTIADGTVRQPFILILAAFSDMAAHSEAEPAINRIVAQGIMRGVTPTEFAPDAPLTRGDFLIAIQHMFSLPRAPGGLNFTDVPASGPLNDAVKAVEPYLGRQMLCFGCALPTNLMLGDPVSRAEATLIITRVLIAQKKLQVLNQTETDSVLAGVPDSGQLSPPARPYFATAILNGIMPSGPQRRIAPEMEVSRANAAIFLDSVQRQFNIPEVKPP
jgi:S-layer homology domain